MYLEDLIKDIPIHENDKYECKIVLNREDTVGWLKTVAGFANCNGGDFFIGVEDKTNKLIGFDRKSVDSERNWFNNKVNEHLTPRPNIKTSFIRYYIRGEERFIIRAHVCESEVKPVVLKYKGIPSIFMRREGYTNGATYEEIIEMSISSKKTQYDRLYSDIEYNSKDFTKLRKFYSLHNGGKKLTDKLLESMGFYNENKFLANGAVLFKDDYSGNKTSVKCSLYSGFSKGDDLIVSINRFSGNILDSIEYIMDFIQQRMNHSIIKLNDSRINIDSYPERALFEGVVNAIAHRNYYMDGTEINIDMYRNRLEISSPGGFYQREPLGKTFDLTGIISKRRNELISEILVKCNVMEAAGTGFDKISDEYKNTDQNHKPYIYSKSDHFTLVLPDLTYNEGVSENSIPDIEFIPLPNGTENDRKILAYCYFESRTASEIAKYLGIADSSYLRKTILENMVVNGYLDKFKVSRSTHYKTIKESVRII